ncbi:hypothetical protein DMB44_01415 [Thermoplasma sp. Kam2015]|uniref:hypothetical protein n=1 Tax=Thermoplasma sp. Kam2015 TaxID=2094122 RepID=UPI000D9045AB|nr:hypothetical protein [Thermoplasma sp. Kam2015]PYB68935.1 hypothetical protein DMB44_01415 [Thermoplasma sp. Kam2015]
MRYKLPKEIYDLASFDENIRFKLKTEAALILNAQRIRALSKDPSKFDRYIEERLAIMKKILNSTGSFSLKEGEKIIVDYDGNDVKISFD